MEFRLLNRQYSDDEKLSRILFYSVVFHYIVFFLFFGNPFLILSEGGKGSGDGGGSNIDVQLLSSSQIGPALSSTLSEPPPLSSSEAEGSGVFDPKNFPAFRPEEGTEEGTEEISSPPESPSTAEAGISMAGDAIPPSKPAARKMPKSMTGPEDCLLKVVGMVCPSGDAECLADYVAFCSTLR